MRGGRAKRRLEAGGERSFEIGPGRGIWLQVARGALIPNGESPRAGDGLGPADLGNLALKAADDAEARHFDLAP